MNTIYKEPIMGKDGRFEIFEVDGNIHIECQYCFDKLTDEITEVYTVFRRDDYNAAIKSLIKQNVCRLTNTQNDYFFSMKIVNGSKIELMFGTENGPKDRRIIDKEPQKLLSICCQEDSFEVL
jgi:hypothetical protein